MATVNVVYCIADYRRALYGSGGLAWFIVQRPPGAVSAFIA